MPFAHIDKEDFSRKKSICQLFWGDFARIREKIALFADFSRMNPFYGLPVSPRKFPARKRLTFSAFSVIINAMSKYDLLWKYVRENCAETLVLAFAQIEKIAGVPLDHSFLSYKKELPAYGFEVQKISLKQKTVTFSKL